MPRRIVFDIRTLADARGNSDGIVRTCRALARFAAQNRPDVVFAIFDLECDGFRAVDPRWVAPILNGAKVDTSHLIDPLGHRQPLRARLPIALRRIVHAIQRPRRRAFVWLEGLRLRAGRPMPWLQRLQSRLVSEKIETELRAPDGTRRSLLPFGVATGPVMALTPDDTVFVAGFDWSALYRIAAFVSRPAAPRLVVLCYDIIPLMFPQFYAERDVSRFRACFHAAFPAATCIIVTAHRIADDVKRYCEDHRLALGPTAVVALGADAPQSAVVADLPSGLVAGRYLLYVSTIEPRKNHRLLFEVWKRLLSEGIPQAHSFKLVCVGRRGWKTAALIAEMEAHPSFGESLLLLTDIDDATLARLYADAAFCVYPSFYEGFGLPIIESFLHGKAVIASTAGALPETVGPYSPCLDPTDDAAWLNVIRDWIVDPQTRAVCQIAIRDGFRRRDWDDAARDVFAAIDRAAPL